MCEPITLKIDRYREYHRDLIAHALSKGIRRYTAIHSNVLLCCILDRIAKAGAPNINQIGERFRTVVELHSGWEDTNRVSILHLSRALRSPDLPERFIEVKQRVDRELGLKLPNGQNQIFLAHDPLLA
jgi:hypothetical protein